nr:ribonuclease H [Tanacetum cinerariifolium]
PKVIAPIDEVVAPELVDSTGLPSSTIVDQDAPSPSKSQTTPETQPLVIPHDVEEDNHDIEVAHMEGGNRFEESFAPVARLEAIRIFSLDTPMVEKSKLDEDKEGKVVDLSNHIDIRYHFINEHVENGVIELYFVNTEYQLANLFTKSLGRERIEFLINKLGMRSFTPETLKQLTDEVDE